MTARRALLLLITISTPLRLLWASRIGPGHDEAYYVAYSLHPDWSYYDHPPLVAWLISFPKLLIGLDSTTLTTRVGFILLFSASTWVLARLTAQFFGDWAGLSAALLLNLSGYEPLAAGAFALPDGPLTFFWILTLDRLSIALTSRPSRRGALTPWILVGLAWGGALLSKYQALALPLGTLAYLLLEPRARPWLRRPGPYLALAIGLLLFSPVLGWNAAHNWTSFRFHGLRTLDHGLWPRPDYILRALLGQAAYLLPWVWLLLLKSLVRTLRTNPHSPSGATDRLFLVHTLAPLALFLAPACFRPLLPHWTLPALLSSYPLAGAWLATQARSRPRHTHRALLAMTSALLLMAAFLTFHTRHGILQKPFLGTTQLLPPSADPTADTCGWPETAVELKRRGLVGRPGTFLFTSRWYLSGQLTRTLEGATPVHCFNPSNSHAFSHWTHPESTVGLDGLLVVVDESSTEPAVYDRWFEKILPAGEFSVLRAGIPIRRIRLYNCLNQTTPFPQIPANASPAATTTRLATQHPKHPPASPTPSHTR
jgi:4-amino-4-deoxy-L-arabinose transferase-like glycosyltransferase